MRHTHTHTHSCLCLDSTMTIIAIIILLYYRVLPPCYFKRQQERNGQCDRQGGQMRWWKFKRKQKTRFVINDYWTSLWDHQWVHPPCVCVHMWDSMCVCIYTYTPCSSSRSHKEFSVSTRTSSHLSSYVTHSVTFFLFAFFSSITKTMTQ